ncbi:hypothetical protein EYZ11_000295 [Aspergillus tanneri]|uniref:Glycosyltransferase 2-like domain-containing protein n=1 Tax=Aspergillus tanneri TaxID=1220188 RepID=A0A4S3JXI3_9EURO|nr:hypothetical protein EYZ11_000295 [Aspergillus tanneri]
MLSAFVYLVLVGLPVWKGAVFWLYWAMQNRLTFHGGWAIATGIMIIYTFAPLFILFEEDAPSPDYFKKRRITPSAPDTALLIPCFKSAPVIRLTLEAALRIFPAAHIFVIANGDSPKPIDNTEEICRSYGVNHIWSPIGSKIIAIFVGCYAAKAFRYVLLIDDDCALPPSFLVVSSRLTDRVRCIGYTIKSVDPQSSKISFCQQAQDLEYKMSGLHRTFAGRIGSTTFPHGAISLWDREFLKQVFQDHPGFSISEDWFLGNSCRRMGGRIKMCSSVFVGTATPSAIFYAGGSRKRGGFGEMTVFKQRFLRWNFFFASGLWYNLSYIFGSWRLGWWEIGTKVFVLQEYEQIYETIVYIFAPFILPISFLLRPGFCANLLGSTLALYLISVAIFNEVHLRLKKERVRWRVLLWYYVCPVFRAETPQGYREPSGRRGRSEAGNPEGFQTGSSWIGKEHDGEEYEHTEQNR